jgi:exosortase H (IPTLxxWG-CTERM-specific)
VWGRACYDAPPKAMQRNQVLFLLKFFGILVGAYLLIAWNPVNDNVIVPFTKAIAGWSGALLNLMGQKVAINGTVIASSKFGVNINNGCNGVEAMLILLASIGAFPASMKARLAGLALGAIAVQLLNAVRIVTLYLLGAYQPKLFDMFHTAVWQVVIIAAAIGFFLLWSARVAPNRLASRA